MRIKSITQRGDTIVEVLIAITVIGSVLTGAYATSRRSLNNMRQAQERVEALKVAEEQIERLKVFASTNPTYSYPSNFCIYFNGATSSNTAQSNPTATNVHTNCQRTPSGSGVAYKSNIVRDSSTQVFTVTIIWDGLGTGVQSLTLPYKVAS